MCDSARMNIQHFFNDRTEIRTYRPLPRLRLPHGSTGTPGTCGKKATQSKARANNCGCSHVLTNGWTCRASQPIPSHPTHLKDSGITFSARENCAADMKPLCSIYSESCTPTFALRHRPVSTCSCK